MILQDAPYRVARHGDGSMIHHSYYIVNMLVTCSKIYKKELGIDSPF